MLRKVRKARAAKAKREEYRDCRGVFLSEVHNYLRGPVSSWPLAKQVKDSRIAGFMHERYKGICWLCEKLSIGNLEMHHLVSRSDELCNVVMLGGAFSNCQCHARIQHDPTALRTLLRAKHERDPLHLDFVRIALLRRKLFLFDSLEEP